MSEPTIAKALVAAQTDMPKVEKRGRNPHFKNDYVTLDDLIDSVRPVLNKHGIAVVQFPSTLDGNMPALTTILVHGATGERLEATMPLILAKGDMQGVGAAITYARRYMLAAALGIAEGSDDDGNQASAASAAGRAAPSANPAPAGPPDPPFKAPDGAAPAPRNPSLITKAQIDRMWARFRLHHMPDTVLRGLAIQICGDQIMGDDGNAHVHLIPKAKYDELIAEIDALEDIPF